MNIFNIIFSFALPVRKQFSLQSSNIIVYSGDYVVDENIFDDILNQFYGQVSFEMRIKVEGTEYIPYAINVKYYKFDFSF